MANDSPNELAGYHCPKCDYELRGLTESRCPECGSPFSKPEIAAYKDQRWPPQRFFRALIVATIPWFIAYVLVDVIHDTGDRVKLSWWTFPFLAMPLQLVVGVVASLALEARSTRWMKRLGAVLTVILWLQILGHIAITVGTL